MDKNAQFIPMSGAADYLGPGAVETNRYEDEILDLVRRDSVSLNRMRGTRANGHPHRYFEQTAVSQGKATDPRNLAPTNSNPTRVENWAPIKAIVNQTGLSLFDREVTQQQGQFSSVVGQDIEDIVTGVRLVQADKLWTGADTNIKTPTSVEYMGILRQITGFTTVIGPGDSIIDGIKSVVAKLVNQKGFKVRPTGVYLNSILADHVDREAKATDVTVGEVEVIPGVTAPAIATRAGKLPFIDEPFIPNATDNSFGFAAPPAGYENLFAVVLAENLIERPYISGTEDNPNPRLFQLGLTSDLSGQFVAVMFDTVIVKAPSYAHAIICVQRPIADGETGQV